VVITPYRQGRHDPLSRPQDDPSHWAAADTLDAPEQFHVTGQRAAIVVAQPAQDVDQPYSPPRRVRLATACILAPEAATMRRRFGGRREPYGGPGVVACWRRPADFWALADATEMSRTTARTPIERDRHSRGNRSASLRMSGNHSRRFSGQFWAACTASITIVHNDD
jgi:hypothetical protein